MQAVKEEYCMIKTQNVSKTYSNGSKETYALRDISINIERGEYVSILGKSGSGKTTLMNILGLLDTPSTGMLYIDNENMSSVGSKKRALCRNNKIGYIFQSFYLEPSYTVYMNIEVPLLIAGIGKSERIVKIREVLEKIGLYDKRSNKVAELSGGEKQRVCIARALVNDPSIILADEPCGNLDTFNASHILNLFDELNRTGRTIIMITHNEEHAQRAHRIIHMCDGKVIL